MKPCIKCGENPRQKTGNKGRDCHCKQCWTARSAEWNKKNKDRVKDRSLRAKFGISLTEYTSKLTAQNGLCAICRQGNCDRRALAVDHNHQTKRVRGLLCGNCNRGIGNLRECPAILQRAIEYLNQYAD